MQSLFIKKVLAVVGIFALVNTPVLAMCQKQEDTVQKHPASSDQMAHSNNEFAFDLYHQLASENEGENLFFSPYSISIALAMTAEGARNDTAEEMGSVLKWSQSMRRNGDQQNPWETSQIHSGLAYLNRLLDQQADTPEKQAIRDKITALTKELDELRAKNEESPRIHPEPGKKERELIKKLNDLIGQVDQYELNIANALWGEQTYRFNPEFVDTVTDAYDAGAMRLVDFIRNFESQRKLINQWVEEKTSGRIKDLLPPRSLDPDTRMVLANAIYFKGDWKTPFKKARTLDQDFLLTDGGKTTVPLMSHRNLESARYCAFNADGTLFDTPRMIDRGANDPSHYPEEDGFAMVELPYRGGDLSMVVLVPNSANGIAELEQRLNSESVGEWIGQMEERKVNVFLPRFTCETSHQLKKTLSAMGMATAFDPQTADFRGMTLSGIKDLYISDAYHKAFVAVNEEGTEAAAATAIVMKRLSANITVPFVPTIRADRPFVYLIRDTRTDTILFVGRMLNPADTTK